jgi:hypothetical protein
VTTVISGGTAPRAPGGTVTRWPPGIGIPFTKALSRSAILPGDGNYRDNLNTGIIAMTMDGIAKDKGPGPGAARRARGNRR